MERRHVSPLPQDRRQIAWRYVSGHRFRHLFCTAPYPDVLSGYLHSCGSLTKIQVYWKDILIYSMNKAILARKAEFVKPRRKTHSVDASVALFTTPSLAFPLSLRSWPCE